MSRLNWRSRSVLAAGAAAVLVGTGVAALATTGGPGSDPAPATTSPADPRLATDDRSAELRRSVGDLMGQVDALEASLATPTPSPSATPGGVADDRGGDRPAGVSDDGPGHDAYDDHGGLDDDGDDDAYDDDDHGGDRGDDDDRGDDHGGSESDDD